jgi:hypothetical protein
MGTVRFWDGSDTRVDAGDCIVLTGWDDELVPLVVDEIARRDVRLFRVASAADGFRDIFSAYLAWVKGAVCP